jgi:hypothetical protein
VLLAWSDRNHAVLDSRNAFKSFCYMTEFDLRTVLGMVNYDTAEEVALFKDAGGSINSYVPGEIISARGV